MSQLSVDPLLVFKDVLGIFCVHTMESFHTYMLMQYKRKNSQITNTENISLMQMTIL